MQPADRLYYNVKEARLPTYGLVLLINSDFLRM